METAIKTVQILGIPFYNDSLETALQIAHHDGGLFLAPSGPGLAELGNNPYYDRALQKADINLIDSGYLALLWKKRTGESLQRHSGLKFIQALIETSSFKKNTRQLWVMPDQVHSDATKHYLSKQQIKLDDEQTPPRCSGLPGPSGKHKITVKTLLCTRKERIVRTQNLVFLFVDKYIIHNKPFQE